MVLMIVKAYGSEIGVFMARSRGTTSGLLLLAVLTHFKPVPSMSARCLHSITIKKMIDDYKGLQTRNLRHGALWRHFRFIVIGDFYSFLASFVDQRTLLALHNYSINDSTLEMISA